MAESKLLSFANKVRLATAGDLGKGLFARENIRTGDNVLHYENPHVAVLDTERLEDTCHGCFGKRSLEAEPENEIVLKACTGCQVVKYCDKTCQARDWKFAHSLECAIYRDLKPKILPINARALLRIVLRMKAKKNTYTKEEQGYFASLETHIHEIRQNNPTQWERIELTTKAVKEYSGTDFAEDIISTFGAQLDVNSFNMTNAVYDRIGLYLHSFAGFMNHSCDYNCVVGFDGPELYVKAIRRIRRNEQVFISYVDATNPVHRRQKELRERYFFECECTKCSSEITASPDPNITEEEQTYAGSAYALLESSPGPHDRWKVERTIQDLISHSWPKTRQPFVSILDESIAIDLSIGEFGHAFLDCALRYLHIDREVYPQEAHPLRALHAWTLAKLAMNFAQSDPDFELPNFIKGRGASALLENNGVHVDYALIAWSVLAGLVAKKAENCLVPGFNKMIERAFLDVHGEFMRLGQDPRGMGPQINKEWSKIREVMHGYRTEILREKDE
ncbi:hypothetical protein BJX61DRAFT_543038 [Aspergillus egyptiacus]|nr:hypothetical protein BJX61DRAFT_543038 [Aspergillus egyptiacus]